jgi:hypothetical protein
MTKHYIDFSQNFNTSQTQSKQVETLSHKCSKLVQDSSRFRHIQTFSLETIIQLVGFVSLMLIFIC